MKLYKALKEKNKLSGEIAKLRQKIHQKNSKIEGEKSYYDVRELYDKMHEKVNKLIELKTKINEKNLKIQEDIYRLAEFKGMVNFFRGLPVKEGEIKNSYGDDAPVNFIVEINELERDETIARYEKQIEETQEKIDQFNITTDIDFELE